MFVNMGVMKHEILKVWDTTHMEENVIRPTGTDLKVMLLTEKYNLQDDMHSDHMCVEEPKKNPTRTSILNAIFQKNNEGYHQTD